MTRTVSIAIAIFCVALALSLAAVAESDREFRARRVFDALNVGAFDAAETAMAACPDLDVRFAEAEGRWTMVQIFAHASALPPLRWLLEHGADPDVASPGDGRTALHLAVERGHVEAVELLLAFDADPSLRSRSGTPVQLASGLRDRHSRARLLALLDRSTPR